MKKKIILVAAALMISTGAVAAEMTCDEIIAQMNREATPEALERFKDLRGSCEGVVEKDGELFMTTRMVVRRVTPSAVTLFLPATDETIRVETDSSTRVMSNGRMRRTRDLSRGDELNIYVSVEEFTQPIIDEVALPQETVEETVEVPAVVVAALPTTG
jgi:hypothetical protein